MGNAGKITAEQIEAQIQPAIINLPRTALVSLENTLNKAGGNFYSNNVDCMASGTYSCQY
jgi:threonine aldolase